MEQTPRATPAGHAPHGPPRRRRGSLLAAIPQLVGIPQLNNRVLPRCHSLAVESKCLNSEDAEVLSSYNTTSPVHPRLSRLRIVTGIVIVLTLCLLALIWQCSVTFKYAKLWRQYRLMGESFSQFIAVHTVFGDVLKKAILYIQEVEVISRGYTMMTPYTPISHLERSGHTQLQCPALRQAVFQSARKQFLSLRRAMLATLAHCPLREEGGPRDVDELYLATTDLAILDGQSSILTAESCGPCQTSQLKALTNLYSDQLSEFIRRHLMGRWPDLVADPSRHAEEPSEWYIILDEASQSAKRELSYLNSSLKLHQPTLTPCSSDEPAEEVREIWGPNDVLPSASRALILHLNIAVNSAQKLVKSSKIECNNGKLVESEVAELEELLAEVKGHLDACQTCLREAGVSVAKLSGHKEHPKSLHPVSPNEDSASKPTEPSPEPINLMDLEEPEIDFIEEEVFEAYIDAEKDDTIPDYDMVDFIAEKREEEKQRMREERKRLKEGGECGLLEEGDTTTGTDSMRTVSGQRTGDAVQSSQEDGGLDECNHKCVTGGGSDATGMRTSMWKVCNLEDELATESGEMPRPTRCDVQYPNPGGVSNSSHVIRSGEDGEGSPADDPTICNKLGVGENIATRIQKPIPKPRRNIPLRYADSSSSSSIERGTLLPSEVETRCSKSSDQAAKEMMIDRDLQHERFLMDTNLETHRQGDSCVMDSVVMATLGQQHMAIPFMQGLAAEAVKMSRERHLAEETFGAEEDSNSNEEI
ncbi:vezatin-like [Diadema antillarum]|uniref:vezatin-like n=1 Tax=Diadema antillarum TaxID=105358 RepID=UPI003A8695B0